MDNKEFGKADLETVKIILWIANRQEGERLTRKDIENFPIRDLHTINQLWLAGSYKKFGFSIQKQIWIDLGGKPGEYDEATFERFVKKVKWAEEDKVTPDIRATSGHLPLGVYVMCGDFDWHKWWASTDRYMAQPEGTIYLEPPIYQSRPIYLEPPQVQTSSPQPRQSLPQVTPLFMLRHLFLVGFLLSLGYLVSGWWGVLAVLVFYTVWLIVFAIKVKIEEVALREAALREAALRKAALQEQERKKKLEKEAARSTYFCLLSREFDDFNT